MRFRVSLFCRWIFFVIMIATVLRICHWTTILLIISVVVRWFCSSRTVFFSLSLLFLFLLLLCAMDVWAYFVRIISFSSLDVQFSFKPNYSISLLCVFSIWWSCSTITHTHRIDKKSKFVERLTYRCKNFIISFRYTSIITQ